MNRNYYTLHLEEKDAPRWEELVKSNHASGFHQSFDWSHFKRLEGWDTYKIGLFDDLDELQGGAIVHQFKFKDGKNFLYIPEGPILNFEEEKELHWQWRVLETALHSIVNLDKKVMTTHIRMEPRIGKVPNWFLLGWTKAGVNLQPRFTLTMDLTQSEETLLAGMKQKGRYNIRLAEKKGVTVRRTDWKEIEKFFELYKQTFSRNHFSGKELPLFKNLEKSMGANCDLYLAEHEGTHLAGALILNHGERSTYLYGASSNENRQLMAPSLLHWEIMKDLKLRGFKEYDFWGAAPDSEDSQHEWHGLTRFKEQFGPQKKKWIGAYDYILQEAAYSEFVQKYES